MLGTYERWGFRSCPFETRPLPASADGAKLLIGRDEDLERIIRRLLATNKLVTVEGANGIGKTSINNVAAFRALEAFLSGKSDQLIVPCEKIFQLRTDSKTDEFIDQVFLQIGITLVKYAEVLKESGRALAGLNSVQKWLMSPTLTNISGSLTAQGYGGVGAGVANVVNTGAGFAKAGFNEQIRTWLNDIFPNGEGGGIVCSIDNLELLRESEAARKLVEALRDEILTVHGLRWILCGATGIVRTLAATPRLQGYLHTPVELRDVDASLSGRIFSTRIDAYKVNESVYMPLLAADFSTVYEILRGNIRDALSTADDYCNWVADIGTELDDPEKLHAQFVEWLHYECGRRLESARPLLSARPLRLFDDIVNAGGQCSPGDNKVFGFDSPQAMRANVLKLEAANLVKSVRDEEDNRRKTILITSNGWMVDYARRVGVGELFPNGEDDPAA